MEPLINPTTVEEIFHRCLFQSGEDKTNATFASGITLNVGFHPQRLESCREEVKAILANLPDTFRKDGGGGMSFLMACNDRNGIQWTGLHRRMEELFLLGLALGEVVCLAPRPMWEILPGGMPYYLIKG